MAEIGVAQGTVLERHIAEIAIAQVGMGQVERFQRQPLEREPAQARVVQTATLKHRIQRFGVVEIRPGQLAGVKPRLSDMHAAKADIVEKVYQKIGFSKKEASELVELVFSSLKDVLQNGEKVKISGFGNFVVRDKKDRMGRDPQRAVPILIPARRVLTFKPSQVLKNILNGLPPV